MSSRLAHQRQVEIRPLRDASGRFLTGNNGGPGRPAGARNRLGEGFLADLAADWEAHGKDTISRVRAEDPAAYLRIIAGLLPREVAVKGEPVNPFDGLEALDLARTIAAIEYEIEHDTDMGREIEARAVKLLESRE